MATSNAVPQPLDDDSQSVTAPQPDAAPQPAPLRPLAEPERSPEVQAEVERIRSSEAYKDISRDSALFFWLSLQRDSRSNGYVFGANFADLRKACQFYRMQYVQRRGTLYKIPMPVTYVDVEQYGSPIDLLVAILESLGSPFAKIGLLRDMRSRTFGTLNSFGVKLLIIGYAECLSYEAYNELLRLTRQLKISVILAGSMELREILGNFVNRRSKRYGEIYNNFLDFHEYRAFEKSDIETLLESWENQVLSSWDQKLALKDIPDVPAFLYQRCEGHAETLYEILRKIAIFKLDNPSHQLSKADIENMVSRRTIPKRS
ncbi:ATP-binding protein [filamentous cyanobacterium CCP1]|nr:ATP-binding protein [filamentous cyanobacterium CCP2]PSB64971.1 ATP-binding protein [filamentous cyanobacterium CCP1]